MYPIYLNNPVNVFIKMLVCTNESDSLNVDVEETAEQTSHKKDKKFVFNHGGKNIWWKCFVLF